MGRYLIIASSRPGDQAAHLQGLWIDTVATSYNCAYHININIQMNYWPAEVTNLAECHRPYFDLIHNLRPEGRKTARDVYGCRGFTAHHNVDGWYETGPFGKAQWGMWPMGAGWSCQHLWEHYSYGGNVDFLRKTAYPIMKDAAEFLLDYLVEHPRTGKLVSGPSISPENYFATKNGDIARVTMGPAMDQMLLQSHEDFIEFLPALPEEWPVGHVTGLRARGGFEIDLYWSQGKLDKARICSTLGNTCRIYSGKAEASVTQDGKAVDAKQEDGVVEFDTGK